MSRFGIAPYHRNGVANYFDDLERTFFSNFPEMNALRMDVVDKGDHYLLQADLPGLKREDIHLDVEGNCLTLSAKNEVKKEDKEENYLRRERISGSFKRQFDVSNVKVEDITATYNNGVLELKLPKKDAPKPESKRIEIK